MNEITGGICSTQSLKTMAADVSAPYVILNLDARVEADITPRQLERMASVAADTDAVMVYGDYNKIGGDDGTELCTVNPYLEGSVRDDFDFGYLAMIKSDVLLECLAEIEDYDYAGWYALRLALSRAGRIVHIPEPLYDVKENIAGTSQFDYVNPRNRKVQIEMEKAFTCHLHKIGALLTPPMAMAVHEGQFPVEASVIIPVKNRAATISKAIESALAQKAEFDINIIVVDNHSTDGTSEAVAAMAEHHPSVIHIVPEELTLGIGGCWNKAIMHPACGRYAIQLDSDDLYAAPDVVQRIVDVFRRDRSAMVIGSYRLTDFELREIPPGVIDHREWTDCNGPNNALRVNGLGAPRAFFTGLLRRYPFPDVSYGEDYAVALRLSRTYRVSRIYDVLYLCRRWSGNSDARLTREKANRFNLYKDTLRSFEIEARIRCAAHSESSK